MLSPPSSSSSNPAVRCLPLPRGPWAPRPDLPSPVVRDRWDLMGHNILDSALKSRDIPLPTKVCLVKAPVFSVVMYGRESWTIKKAECQRIDAFHLWCWRKLLRVPWTATRPKQSILKEISPEYSLEGLMLKLKLRHFGHPL